MSQDYAPYYAVPAEGHRIGLMTCLRCGAVVIVGDNDGGSQIHDDWHAFLAANLELPDLTQGNPQ